MNIYNKYKWVNFIHKSKRHNELKIKSSCKLTTSKLWQQHKKLENVGGKTFSSQMVVEVNQYSDTNVIESKSIKREKYLILNKDNTLLDY